MRNIQHAPLAVIGAGPAGLMAAEQLAKSGQPVLVFDAMASAARKFLLAGVGGMNITHSEPLPDFIQRYREASDFLRPILENFPAEQLRAWIHGLGIETFVGSSGRVFPKEMKAAPLLRAWLTRLRQQGVQFKQRHRLVGLSQIDGVWHWHIENVQGVTLWHFDKLVLALGGGSYPKLGSDGHWQSDLAQAGVAIAPFKASNCGFALPWSDFFKTGYAGLPLKHVSLSLTNLNGQVESKLGEFVLTDYGVEGSLVYALSAPLRELLLHTPAQAQLWLDLLPHFSHSDIIKRLQHSKKGDSLSNMLRKKLSLPALTSALLKECLPTLNTKDPTALARALKRLPLPAVTATRPLAEAISSAGGILLDAVTPELELKALSNVYAVGEMLDWEAPTGGYLLTACLAMGRWIK